jgi:Ca2+-binding RTX toxin-like protein
MAIEASFNPINGVLTATGDDAKNTITATRDGAGNILINGGAVSIDGQPTVANTTQIVASGGNGNDTISLVDSLNEPPLPGASLFGGSGNDVLTGGSGADQLDGGAGNDTVVGGKGTDTAKLGAGNDVFIWNQGDGSDVVEGGDGIDTLDFRGVDTFSETVTISAKNPDGSGGATFFRDQGKIQMDLTSVERVQFEAKGGVDNILIDDLTGTDVKQVDIDLGGPANGGASDVDTITINAPNSDDIKIKDINGVVTVSGLASDVTISNFEAGVDQLVINDQSVTVKNGQTVTVTAVNSNNTGDTSTASDGSHATRMALLGQHMASSFVTVGDGHGGTPIADQPSSHQPLLAQPHA